MEGWIKLHRKSLNHWLYQENRPHTKREAWEDLLLLCNHEDDKVFISGELIDCKRGQSIMSLKTWANSFKWSIQQVRTFFKLLENDSMIKIEGLKYSTRITICNYGLYQNKQQTDNELITICQQTDNELITTNKNDKNDKNNILLSQVDKSTLTPPLTDYFEISFSFWKMFKQNLEDFKLSTADLDKAKFEIWTDPVRLLIETDGKTKDEIREVYKFIKEDDFWIQQIRSTAKLRKKDKNGEKYFDKLLYQARHGKIRKLNKPNQTGVETAKTVESILAEIAATQR